MAGQQKIYLIFFFALSCNIYSLIIVINRKKWNLIKQSLFQTYVVYIVNEFHAEKRKSLSTWSIVLFPGRLYPLGPLWLGFEGHQISLGCGWISEERGWQQTWGSGKPGVGRWRMLWQTLTVASRRPNAIYVHRCWCERWGTSTSPRLWPVMCRYSWDSSVTFSLNWTCPEREILSWKLLFASQSQSSTCSQRRTSYWRFLVYGKAPLLSAAYFTMM